MTKEDFILFCRLFLHSVVSFVVPSISFWCYSVCPFLYCFLTQMGCIFWNYDCAFILQCYHSALLYRFQSNRLFIKAHGRRWKFSFLLIHIDIQLFYLHLLYRLSFPHKALFWDFMLKQIAEAQWIYLVFYILMPWSTCLFK